MFSAKRLGAQRGRPWFVSHARVRTGAHRAIRNDDVLELFRMITTLLAGGSPLLEAIRLAGAHSESVRARQALERVSRQMSSGAPFHAAAANCPEVFEPYAVELIRAGETSGQLGEVLTRLVKFLEDRAQLRSKILGAMMYPMVLATMSVAALFVMMWKVVPTFTLFFKDSGGKVPALTQYVINLSQFFEAYGLYVVVSAPVFLWGLRRYLRSPDGNRRFTNLMLVTPFVGEMVVQMAMQRFCTNLALLLRSGADLLDALRTVQTLWAGFPAYQSASATVHAALGRGKDLATALDGTGLFTPLLVNMVRIGEASGQLVSVLEKLDAYYAERSQKVILRLTAMMEPVIVIFMGVVVGTILAAIYIPMFSMSSGSNG